MFMKNVSIELYYTYMHKKCHRGTVIEHLTSILNAAKQTFY